MSSPLVAIVTPIFQGADHLGACVESVRAQSYEHWIHLLVDNRSTDGTRESARRLAGLDERVRLVAFDQHLGMLANWNRALACVPEEAALVRQLNVDDRMGTDCLASSVAAAEAHPDVAVVSSYFLNGRKRLPRVTHREITRIPGREVVRQLFLGGGDYLAQPSVLLMRKALIANWPSLYEAAGFPPGLDNGPPLCQADKEGFFASLLDSDLLFVPERLVSLREDADSATGYSWRVGAWHAGWMELLMRHGERFLTPREVKRAMRRITFKYVRSSTWRSLKGKPIWDREFSEFHRQSLRYLIPALRERGFSNEARVLGAVARMLGVGSGKSVDAARRPTELEDMAGMDPSQVGE